eukprot:1224124-Amorphochlora_amoeboformis.AAC.2
MAGGLTRRVYRRRGSRRKAARGAAISTGQPDTCPDARRPVSPSQTPPKTRQKVDFDTYFAQNSFRGLVRRARRGCSSFSSGAQSPAPR